MDIILITQDVQQWESLCPVIEQQGASVRMFTAFDAGLMALKEQSPALVMLDLDLDTEALRAAVIEILKVNAMIHTAAISTMTEDTFHDQMEGLGMLMNLPQKPSAADVIRLMDALKAVMS